MREKILVSACLCGENCRYDGKCQKNDDVLSLTKYFDLIPICPEQSGGLKTPRQPSEIQGDKVISKDGKDVTSNYNDGAFWATSIAQIYKIRFAVLKENSPSCGTHFIHDGTFSGKLIQGKGVTVKKLENINVKCFSENEINKLSEEKEK